MFQPFYRALGTGVDGSGLWLAIVQEIAQQHGASVTMEAGEGRDAAAPGTCVTVHFVQGDERYISAPSTVSNG